MRKPRYFNDAELEEAIVDVKNFLGDDVKGHCYAAAEAIYHLAGGKLAGLKPAYLKHEGVTHWLLLRHHMRVIDVTAQQFKTKPDYSQARGRGFLTKKPSRKAQEIIGIIEARR